MNNKGFTLIEIIIVVAIVGIISGIAIPQYQNHIARSQIAIAIAELRGAQPQYELIIHGGSPSSDYTPANIFFSSSSSHICNYIVNPPDIYNAADQALVCHLSQVSPALKGQFVYFSRDKYGGWECKTSLGVDDKYKPAGCR